MKIIAEIQGPTLIEEDQEGYIAFIEQMPGLIETGKTKEEAFNELMISLRVKIIYDSGITI